jgi:hypothetical protein
MLVEPTLAMASLRQLDKQEMDIETLLSPTTRSIAKDQISLKWRYLEQPFFQVSVGH